MAVLQHFTLWVCPKLQSGSAHYTGNFSPKSACGSSSPQAGPCQARAMFALVRCHSCLHTLRRSSLLLLGLPFYSHSPCLSPQGSLNYNVIKGLGNSTWRLCFNCKKWTCTITTEVSKKHGIWLKVAAGGFFRCISVSLPYFIPDRKFGDPGFLGPICILDALCSHLLPFIFTWRSLFNINAICLKRSYLGSDIWGVSDSWPSCWMGLWGYQLYEGHFPFSTIQSNHPIFEVTGLLMVKSMQGLRLKQSMLNFLTSWHLVFSKD